MKPKFIEHIHLDIPKDFTPKENALGDIECSITNKVMIEQVEKIDNEICERIKDIAILNGIDEVYVIDRNAVISALEKQIPKRPFLLRFSANKTFACICNARIKKGDKYCRVCGQALDWSDTE